MNILSISRGHNGSTTLMVDGEIIFYLEEERLSRFKYDGTPLAGIVKAKEYVDHIDHLVICHTHAAMDQQITDWTREDFYASLVRKIFKADTSFDAAGKVQYPFQVHHIHTTHHELHAACGYFNSGFDNAACVIVDGAGSFIHFPKEVDWVKASATLSRSTSPMFEFETRGDMNDMIALESELLQHLGFKVDMYPNNVYPEGDYDEVAKKYGVEILEHEHETQLEKDHGPVYFLKNFPERTSPFWNMNRHEGNTHAKKVDVIIHGIETIGSAERSSDKEMMRKRFNEISDGEYANTLFAQFTKERVLGEMNDFLSKEFFPRFGGGIGMTRMIRAMKLSNLI